MEVFVSLNNILCLVFLTAQFYFAVSREVFVIIRTPGDEDAWNDLDEFKLPESKCNVDCFDWNGYSVLQDFCKCKCAYQKANFGFYSGSWTCLDNTKVRRQAGCNYEFRSVPDKNYPPKIIVKGEQHDAILPTTLCSIDQTTSRYFTCDGRWARIESQSTGPQWFRIQYEKTLSRKRYSYRVTIDSGISDALLGRLISLKIKCRQESSCLLFKLGGTFQCAENVTSLITSPAPATAATSDPNTTAGNLNDKENKEKVKSSGSSSTVVGIVVTLVIIVVIVIVIAVYVYRKRKRGESIWLVDYIYSRVRNTRSTQPKKKTAEETQEEPVYTEIPEEQQRNEPVDQTGGIYSYVLDDPHTAYTAPQPAPYDRLVHNRQGAVEEGTIYSTADDGPVYNVLERPPEVNNITLATENTQDQGPLFQTHEPEYYILEGTDTTEESTDSSFNTEVRASVGAANPDGPQTGPMAPKERRRPPSPPRKP